jgi:hypothetical protein
MLKVPGTVKSSLYEYEIHVPLAKSLKQLIQCAYIYIYIYIYVKEHISPSPRDYVLEFP